MMLYSGTEHQSPGPSVRSHEVENAPSHWTSLPVTWQDHAVPSSEDSIGFGTSCGSAGSIVVDFAAAFPAVRTSIAVVAISNSTG